MKSLLTIFILLFTLMFSSTSYAEWKKVTVSESGDTFYVDFERVRNHEGYLYFWALNDYLKPNKWEDLSFKVYYQGDCTLFRMKPLTYVFHKQPMGGGNGESIQPKGERRDWQYPNPSSVIETLLQTVCDK